MHVKKASLSSLLQVKPQIADHCEAEGCVCCAMGKEKMWQEKHKRKAGC